MAVEGSSRIGFIGFWVASLAIQASAVGQVPTPAPVATAGGEIGLPFVECYSARQFRGSAQSWVFEQDRRGVLYVGNNLGVMEFDGSTWRLIRVGGGDNVRALDADDNGQIFVGGAGDFGYLAADRKGEQEFVSLLDLVPEDERDFNDIWTVSTTGAGIYFLARERLFRLEREDDRNTLGRNPSGELRLKTWAPTGRFLYGFEIGGNYYAHQADVGLMKMVDDSLVVVPGSEQFSGERLQVLIPRPDGKPGFIVGLFNSGLYVFDGTAFRPYTGTAQSALQRNTLYKAAVLPNGHFAFATLDGGLWVTDPQGNTVRTLDLSTGISSNSILAVYVDREGALWFSPENSICRVEIPSSLAYFDVNLGLVGGVLDILRHRGTLYIATSNGTFLLDRATGRFRQVQGLALGNPQSFTLRPFGEDLLVATGTGVYAIRGDRAALRKDNPGGGFASTGLHSSRVDTLMFFTGLIDGIGVLTFDRGGLLRAVDRIPGVRHDFWVFAELTPGILWAGTRTEGVFRIDYREGTTASPSVRQFGITEGLPEGGALPREVNGRLVVETAHGIYQFDGQTESFQRDSVFNVVDFDGVQEEFFLSQAPNGDVWISAGREGAVLRLQGDGSYLAELTPVLRVADVAPTAIYPELDGVVWFGGNESLLRYDPRVGKSYASDYTALVRQVTTEDSVVYGGGVPANGSWTAPEIPFASNALRFHYAASSYARPSETIFQSWLEGFDSHWSTWSTDVRRDYTNLPPGDYNFRVRAINVYGQQSQEANFAFSIMPPWYRTWWAYLGYVVLLAAGIFAVDRVQRRRLLHKERERAALREAELRAESAEAEARNVELLSRIGREITASLSIDRIIDKVYENVNDLMDASVFSIGIYNEQAKRLEYAGSKEKGRTMDPFFYNIDDEDRLAVWCFRNREEVIIHDFERDHKKYLKKWLPPVSGELTESVLYLPLILKDRVVGVITAQSFSKNAYSDYELNILRNLATYTAIAIDNAEAYQRLNGILVDLRAAQDRLVQSEKMASLGQLTAGIAHEIKNPLNFVNNFAAVSAELTDELVEEIDKNMDRKLAEVADELREILADLKINAGLINEHGKRADGIVKSMLQHSRGDHTLQQPTDVNGLLEEYVNLAYHGMRAADSDFNASIERQYDNAVGSVNMVPQEIGRVLINLLNNAFYAVNERAKLSKDGYQPTVTVTTKRAGTGVEISVRDNGTGIPESVKAKIFEPFFTTKPTGSGTGLGLSMSYDIVTKGHAGDLRVESKPGEFTHFVIYLPGDRA